MNNTTASSSSSSSQAQSSSQLKDEYLKNFTFYCKLFYQRSLSIYDLTWADSTSARRCQDDEEKSTLITPSSSAATTLSDKENMDDEKSLEASRAILHALEYQILNAHHENVTREYLDFITSDSVQRHSEILKSCGLLPHASQPSPLLSASCSSLSSTHSSSSSSLPVTTLSTSSKGMGDSSYRIESSKTHTESFNHSLSLSQELLMEYIHIRNKERRNAHEMQMKQREKYLCQLIKDLCLKKSPLIHNNPLPDTQENATVQMDVISQQIAPQRDTCQSSVVTTQIFLKDTKRQIQNFVSKYKSCVGTHSFMAGIRALMEMQVKHEKDIVVWTFPGSTLSEVNYNTAQNVDDCKDDLLALTRGGNNYMQESIKLLTAFMTYHPEIDPDRSEQGRDTNSESMLLSFSIHDCVSNAFLNYLISALPKACELHAKPAGRLHISDNSPMFGGRKNANGEKDEDFWMSFSNAFPWKMYGFRCDIL